MRVVSLCTFLLLTAMSTATWATPSRAGFTIAFQEVETDLSIITTSVMPADRLLIRTVAQAWSEQGSLRQSAGGWEWLAPEEPGHYAIYFNHASERLTLQVFVLTPFQNGQQDALDGFRIGSYQQELFRGLATYAAPQGFIDLSNELAELPVSPSFTIGQFISKQQPEHEKTYLLVLPAMLIKLETLLEAINQEGWAAPTLHVMSGFRTPWYNQSIGNNTSTSRHLYGGAADVWIDSDGDGEMDDLNRDGVVDREDAVTLAQLAESLEARGGRNWPPGGIGIYDATQWHGPFVHIDSRGYQARW